MQLPPPVSFEEQHLGEAVGQSLSRWQRSLAEVPVQLLAAMQDAAMPPVGRQQISPVLQSPGSSQLTADPLHAAPLARQE